LTLHHSKVIERQLPASSQHEIHGKHGTRVTVRNLFGNIPVRVKQRGIVAEHKTEHDRLWELLRREVTRLMLSWREPVSVRVRDADRKTSISLSNSSQSGHNTRTHRSGLQSPLNILTQAGYITHDEWPSWVPVSASTSTISIKGAISLDPAPSKRVQFMSLGATPLSADTGHNELYDEINRLFALSSFGTLEHDTYVDEDEKARRHDDNRFKFDGYTNRQLKARKGVDRYPMFHLHLTLTRDGKLNRAETLFSEDNANLSTVMDVLKAMITQWLAVHYFQPRRRTQKHVHRLTSATSSHNTETDDETDDNASTDRQDRQLRPLSHSRVASAPPISRLATTNSGKRKRSPGSLSRKDTDRNRHLAFSVWSRIKSGNATFPDNRGIKKDVRLSDQSALGAQSSTAPCFAKFVATPVLAGSLDGGGGADCPVTHDDYVDGHQYDEAVPWTDPITKKMYFLNARTGCVLPRPPHRPQTDPLPNVRGNTLRDFNKSVRLRPTSNTTSNDSNTWLNGVLRTWENPVFMPAETKIQQAIPPEDQHHHDCTHRDTGRGLNDGILNAISTSNASKLSRAGLEKAEVMAQLDRKFILVRMKAFKDDVEGSRVGKGALVLIDQHAADERLRVEALLAELCTPLPEGTRSYRTKLGHESHVAFSILDKPIQFTLSAQEQRQFTTHAARFAAWGILFDIVNSTTSSTRLQPILSVTALPPVISERCKADPQILIAFVRTTVWNYADADHLPPPVDELDLRHASSSDPAEWVRRVSSCPEGLIDLVNSRACRSAIMFNDELSMEECSDLVRNLCRCVFPFMCAHGRPSMVPLIDIGTALSFETATEHMAHGGFVAAWKRWQKK
jgi:DNA mismatch repair protein MLH3